MEKNPCTRLVAALGEVRRKVPALSYGDYRELQLMNRQYAFSRNYNGTCVVVTVNNDDNDFTMTLPVECEEEYIGTLSGQRIHPNNRCISVCVKANSGDIWVPARVFENAKPMTAAIDATEVAKQQPKAEKLAEKGTLTQETPKKTVEQEKTVPKVDEVVKTEASEQKAESRSCSASKDAAKESEEFAKGKIAGLQEAVLALMEKNGPITDQMRKDVMDNVCIKSSSEQISSRIFTVPMR